jgi:hypothetical protein
MFFWNASTAFSLDQAEHDPVLRVLVARRIIRDVDAGELVECVTDEHDGSDSHKSAAKRAVTQSER